MNLLAPVGWSENAGKKLGKKSSSLSNKILTGIRFHLYKEPVHKAN